MYIVQEGREQAVEKIRKGDKRIGQTKKTDNKLQ